MAMIKAISCERRFFQSFISPSYNKLKLLKKFFIWFDIGFLVKLSMIPMNLALKIKIPIIISMINWLNLVIVFHDDNRDKKKNSPEDPLSQDPT